MDESTPKIISEPGKYLLPNEVEITIIEVPQGDKHVYVNAPDYAHQFVPMRLRVGPASPNMS